MGRPTPSPARPSSGRFRDSEHEPSADLLGALPYGVQGLVVDAHRLRLEFDAMGPIDGWRVRVIGDWLTHLCAGTATVWPSSFGSTTPCITS